MKIKQTPNELVIQETPGCLWIFGLFFAVIGGIFVYGSLGGFTNADEVPRYVIYFSFLMGIIAVGVGFWIIFRAPVSTLIVNRADETLTYTKYGLFGKRQTAYGFDQIKQFCLIEEKDSEGDPIWSLGLELANGETLKISSLESHNENFKRDFVFQTNEFMFKQMPSYQAALELEDESAKKIS